MADATHRRPLSRQVWAATMGSPLPADVHTVAVIGDLHGHLGAAARLLVNRLGAHPDTWLLPPGVAVVQTGDLLHKGPHGAELLARVDDAIAVNAGRWVQLWGNHEAATIDRRPRGWERHGAEPQEVADTLERWWRTGTAKAAVAVPTTAGDVLVSHAGLSVGWWERLGAPTDAHAAAAAANAQLGRDPHEVFGRGRILDGGAPQPDAGPVWCDTSAEGWAGWLERGHVPFHQVHGHAAPWSWAARRWARHTPRQLRRAVQVDATTRRVSTQVAGRSLMSLDVAPDHRGLTGEPLVVMAVPPHAAQPAPRPAAA